MGATFLAGASFFAAAFLTGADFMPLTGAILLTSPGKSGSRRGFLTVTSLAAGLLTAGVFGTGCFVAGFLATAGCFSLAVFLLRRFFATLAAGAFAAARAASASLFLRDGFRSLVGYRASLCSIIVSIHTCQ